MGCRHPAARRIGGIRRELQREQERGRGPRCHAGSDYLIAVCDSGNTHRSDMQLISLGWRVARDASSGMAESEAEGIT